MGIPLQKTLGRKWSCLIAYAFFSVPGSFLQLFAPKLAALVIGRFWNGESVLCENLITSFLNHNRSWGRNPNHH